MKLFTSILAAILFISTTALAYDWTYVGPVKAHSTREKVVDLPSGKSIVEVWAVGDEKITCVFVDKGTGNVAYEAKDTIRCVGGANLALPARILVRITNNGDKDIESRIQVRDVK